MCSAVSCWQALLKSPPITSLPLAVRGREELALGQEAGMKSPKEEVRVGPTPRDRSRLHLPFLPQPNSCPWFTVIRLGKGFHVQVLIWGLHLREAPVWRQGHQRGNHPFQPRALGAWEGSHFRIKQPPLAGKHSQSYVLGRQQDFLNFHIKLCLKSILNTF